MRNLFLVFFLSLSFVLLGQEQEIASSINTTRVEKWSGALDGIHPIELELKIEDKQVSGFYILLNSNQKFELNGSISNQEYHLQEYDENFKISGNIHFTKKENNLEGIWSNTANDLFLRLQLQSKKDSSKPKDACRENNWKKSYYGLFRKSKLHLRLLKENNCPLKIEFTMDGIPVQAKLTCHDKECNQFNLYSKELEHLFKSVECLLISNDKLKLKLIDDTGNVFNIRMEKGEELFFNCHSIANYTSRMDLIYPETANDGFKSFMTDIIDDFQKAHQLKLQKTTPNSLDQSVENRFRIISSVWTDIHIFSDRFLSGLITDQNNIGVENNRLAFVYDLEKNKLIDPSTFFKSPENLIQKASVFIENQKKLYKPFKEMNSVEWIQKQKFEFTSISRDGFVLSTSFNNIYGERSITLPYSEVKDLLKKDFKRAMNID